MNSWEIYLALFLLIITFLPISYDLGWNAGYNVGFKRRES